MVLLSRLFD